MTARTHAKLTAAEAATKPESELVRIAGAAYTRIAAHDPSVVNQPGRLAEQIETETGVSFETAAFVALSGVRSRTRT